MKIKYFIFLLLAVSCGFKGTEVDLILHNAHIYSGSNLDQTSQAVAVKDGIIVALGAEHQILNKYASKNKIDLKGQPVYPGFIDAHSHFISLGESLLWADLVNTDSFEQVLSKTFTYKSKFTHDWILGRGWDQNDWPSAEFPTNEELNKRFPNSPVYLERIDGHAALVNNYALKLAAINEFTNVTGGEIVKLNGRPTGVLVDNAVTLVRDLIPEMSSSDKIKAIKIAENKCISAGLTTITEAGLHYTDILLIDSLHKSGDLSIKVYAMYSDTPENYNYADTLKKSLKTSKLNACSFKYFADGSLGSYGAFLKKPYSDKTKKTGSLLNTAKHFSLKAEWCLNKGYQMNTHCIGDSANSKMLDIYAKTLKKTNDLRWRIEHCQVISPEDLSQFKNFNIIPSVQPLHATSDFPWFKERLGLTRSKNAYTYSQLLDQIGIVALGTDFPVETHKPLNTFYAAVYRKNISGYPVSGVQPSEALTRKEALLGMTLWSALANFQENSSGTIEISKAADFTILDRDILKVKEKYLPETKVTYTIIDGEIKFQGVY